MDLQDFVGTWRSDGGAPHVTMTFTWTPTDDGLQGAWVMEVLTPPPGAGEWMSRPGPRRHEPRTGPATLEGDRLLFAADGVPCLAEFRLVGEGEATMGVALDKLPPELCRPVHQRAFDAHRARLTRVPGVSVGLL